MSVVMKLVFIHVLVIMFSSTISTSTAAVSKDQTACTLCYSCDNPCQPQPLPPPPPPPVPICPPPSPPPTPPPPSLPNCPPPPPEECPACVIPFPKYAPPPPLYVPIPNSNMPPGNGQFYGPPTPGYDNNPTPYFPHYNPSMASSTLNLVHSKLQVTLLPIFLSLWFM